jgi:hypothetical protein
MKNKIIWLLALVLTLNALGLAGCTVRRDVYVDRWHHPHPWGWYYRR